MKMKEIKPCYNSNKKPDISSVVESTLKLIDKNRILTIVINDPQRATDSRTVINEILKHYSDRMIRILIATGTHKFKSSEKAAFESVIMGNDKFMDIKWHNCYDKDLVEIGTGSKKWACNPWLLDDTNLLAIGSIEPHYFAGLTGAHKTIAIGCASYESIQSNHQLAMDPLARPFVLDGNPVYKNIMDKFNMLNSIRYILLINLIQINDKIVDIAGGDFQKSFSIIKNVEKIYLHKINKKADLLIIDVTGILSNSFYQAEKGIKNNEWAVRNGGYIIFKADCRNGIGQDDFFKFLRNKYSYDSIFAEVIANGYKLGDHKAVKLRYLTDENHRNVKVFIISSGIDRYEADILNFIKVNTVGEVFEQIPKNKKIKNAYYIHDAANMCVVAK